jgi:hypothetical protein
MHFPNKAGDHEDTDEILFAELKAAGIPAIQDTQTCSQSMNDMLRKLSGEVKTCVRGVLHGWEFERAWYYWRAKGPGLEYPIAAALHEKFGKEVRVEGDCACQSPYDANKGLAICNYHVDTPEGLKALADAIKRVVEKYAIL